MKSLLIAVARGVGVAVLAVMLRAAFEWLMLRIA
jgi:hypothetical protein